MEFVLEWLKEMWGRASNLWLRAGILFVAVFLVVLLLISLLSDIEIRVLTIAIIIALVVGTGYLLSARRYYLQKAFWKLYDNLQLALGLVLLFTVICGAFDLTKSFRFIALVLGIILATMLLTRYSLQIYGVKILGAAKQLPISSEYGKLLDTIAFGYRDSPTNHGWQLHGDQPTLKHVYYPHFGRTLKIVPSGDYHLDYTVTGDDQRGTKIEFATTINDSWSIYAKLALRRKTRPVSFNKWLKIEHGAAPPRRIGGNEWKIYVEPVQSIGKLGIYRIDLEEAVGKTFALDEEQWSYGLLEGFRLRREQCLAYISIFKSRNRESYT